MLLMGLLNKILLVAALLRGNILKIYIWQLADIVFEVNFTFLFSGISF
jgi:hypothetical protein